MMILRNFCAVYVSMTLGFRIARFITLSLYFDMSLAPMR